MKPPGPFEPDLFDDSVREPEDDLPRVSLVPPPQAHSIPPPVDPGQGSLGAPDPLARYELRRSLGRGAMGEVHLCKDTRIGRDVAMKAILPLYEGDPQVRARFLREARVQGQLEHPSIVPVYDLGVDAEGSTYFTMKCLRGLTLSQILKGLRKGDPEIVETYSRQKLLRAFSAACLAVDFAHSRGVLHRDLKPSNIMLGDFGEVYILDWGLAKLRKDAPEAALPLDAHADDLKTAAGKILGTFGYMSPEQAMGKVGLLDARSDVYSLGCTLFELLALEPLHARDGWNAMMVATLQGADARPSVRAPERDIPGELEAICVKATALDPAERFASARALHEAIERFLHGDTDNAVRRELSARHAHAAEQAARRAESPGEATAAAAARRESLREVGRALALDPGNEEALRTLARVVTRPPTEVPPEVSAEVKGETLARLRLALRDGVRFDVASLALMIPFGLWMGVQGPAGLLAVVGLTAISSALKLLAAQSDGTRRTYVFGYGAYLFNIAAMSLIGRVFGPLFFLPMLISSFTFAFAMTHSGRFRAAIMGTGCLALVLPLGLELCGILPRSYAFRDGAMLILPPGASLPEIPTLVGLAVSSMFMIVGPTLLMGRVQRALRRAEVRSATQAWHLRQLVPAEARKPATTRPPSPSRP
ncbi:serine/threonine-protein kinase [Polyangium aurulentum]|uniref:serine/threonine-protein kinase n=1 Tax=Polyangium aurulentum TaxID=2567896 RepID=UPI0010AE1207|nr:serine/threonine-protein kinase [Polyangium aurulentum]UQA58301.1 serine/threonine protein kinase [Polyangium aurulentum]